jgi:hypothetical protein
MKAASVSDSSRKSRFCVYFSRRRQSFGKIGPDPLERWRPPIPLQCPSCLRARIRLQPLGQPSLRLPARTADPKVVSTATDAACRLLHVLPAGAGQGGGCLRRRSGKMGAHGGILSRASPLPLRGLVRRQTLQKRVLDTQSSSPQRSMSAQCRGGPVRSKRRYPMASLRWVVTMLSLPARSAMVRATLSTR